MNFEQELKELIAAAREAGVDRDRIIAMLEEYTQILEDENEDEGEGEGEGEGDGDGS
jgi:hypothetical protein